MRGLGGPGPVSSGAPPWGDPAQPLGNAVPEKLRATQDAGSAAPRRTRPQKAFVLQKAFALACLRGEKVSAAIPDQPANSPAGTAGEGAGATASAPTAGAFRPDDRKFDKNLMLRIWRTQQTAVVPVRTLAPWRKESAEEGGQRRQRRAEARREATEVRMEALETKAQKAAAGATQPGSWEAAD